MANICSENLKKFIDRQISAAIRPLRRRLDNMALLGKALLINDDKTPAVQALTVNEEVINDARYIQDYGHYSKPPVGSESVLLKIQGNPGNVAVLKIGNRELRFKGLKSGEVAIADNSGCYIHLKNGGNIDVIAPETLNATSKIVNITGSETVNINSKNTTVTADTLTVNAQNTTINGIVNLAGGGAGIARLGDQVEVDPVTHKGTIISASTEVTSS